MKCSVNYESHLFWFGWLGVQAALQHPYGLHVLLLPSVIYRMAQMWVVFYNDEVHNLLWHYQAVVSPLRAVNSSSSLVSASCSSRNWIQGVNLDNFFQVWHLFLFSSLDIRCLALHPRLRLQSLKTNKCLQSYLFHFTNNRGNQMISKTKCTTFIPIKLGKKNSTLSQNLVTETSRTQCLSQLSDVLGRMSKSSACVLPYCLSG